LVSRTRLMKTEWFPRSHDSRLSFYLDAESVTQNSTIIPIMHHDEGLGAPSAFSANPENASFGTSSSSNCFVESRVDNIFCEISLSLTKGAIETDKIHSLRIAFMPMALAFSEVYDVTDEVSTADIKTTLELTKESTNREAYPLYSDVKLIEKFSGSGTFAAEQPGLTASQVIESVAFDHDIFYDALKYLKISEKMRTVIGGLRWITLTKTRPFARIRIRQRSAAKRMNPYTFMGVLIHLPVGDTHYQDFSAADTTDINHVLVSSNIRYFEWNQEFDFGRV